MGYYGRSAYRGDYYAGHRLQGIRPLSIGPSPGFSRGSVLPVMPRGDYYRGAMGDPGLFDFIGNAVSAIGGVAKNILPVAAPILGSALGGPIGGIAGGFLGNLLGGGGNPAPPAMAATVPGMTGTPVMMPGTPFSSTQFSLGGPSGVAYSSQHGGPSAPSQSVRLNAADARGYDKPQAHVAHRRVDSWVVSDRRHMNPLNIRALRRGLRRAKGFAKYARKVLHFTNPGKHVGAFKFAKGKKR